MIKKFEEFINEELDTSTYLDAAKKLKSLGHVKRAKRLSDHTNPGFEYITLPISFKNYIFDINSKNIEFVDDLEGSVPFLTIKDDNGDRLFDVTSKGFFTEPDNDKGIPKLDDRKSAINFRKLIKNWLESNPLHQDDEGMGDIKLNWLYQE